MKICLEKLLTHTKASKKLETDIMGEFKEYMESWAWEQGSITNDCLLKMMDEYRADTVGTLKSELESLKNSA